jgi:hypothetical protein
MAEKLIEFEKWGIEDIRDLLNCAMDDGEWHTPSASDINIHTNNGFSIYGRCNISKHSTYHDIEHWFNINAYSVKIWKVEYIRNRANAHHYRPIYNIQQLANKLKLHSLI